MMRSTIASIRLWRLWEGIACNSIRWDKWRALVLTNRTREILGIHTSGSQLSALIPCIHSQTMYPGSLPEHPPLKHVNQTGSVKPRVAKTAPCMLTDTDLEGGRF
jgi:hypothetical protein